MERMKNRAIKRLARDNKITKYKGLLILWAQFIPTIIYHLYLHAKFYIFRKGLKENKNTFFVVMPMNCCPFRDWKDALSCDRADKYSGEKERYCYCFLRENKIDESCTEKNCPINVENN
jgi:hypothetical protein